LRTRPELGTTLQIINQPLARKPAMNVLNIHGDTPRQARQLSERLGQLAGRSRPEPQEAGDGPPSIVLSERLPDILAHFLRWNRRREDVEDKLRGQQLMAD
jgi:hypothetical protein